ncbi:MAG: hypothetical protein WAX89_01440 [Alphaproteobacteria bacterium]
MRYSARIILKFYRLHALLNHMVLAMLFTAIILCLWGHSGTALLLAAIALVLEGTNQWSKHMLNKLWRHAMAANIFR